jgi:hypothetical protein
MKRINKRIKTVSQFAIIQPNIKMLFIITIFMTISAQNPNFHSFLPNANALT